MVDLNGVYKSKNLKKEFKDLYEDNLKDIRKKNHQNIVIGPFNLN